jgi:phospholipid/cholesterol/gamma-HCH transport system permease protein
VRGLRRRPSRWCRGTPGSWLSTHGGSEGIGSVTTKAVVNSSPAVIVLDMLISGAGFFIFPKG